MGSQDPALAKWLQVSLERAFPAGGWAVGVVCDSLAACPDADTVQSTIDSYLGSSADTPAIVREYWSRRSGAAPLAAEGLRQLPSRAEAPPARPQQPSRPAPAPGAAAPPPRGRAAKTAAAAAAADAQPAAASSAPSWHGEVVNCLACGYVHDCRGKAAKRVAMVTFLATNACAFCGKTIPPEATGTAPPAVDAAAAAATAATARLVEFDRTHAQRSVVVDDQSDYVPRVEDIDGDAWLSDTEKVKLRAAAAAAEAATEAAKKKVVVTIDLLGRRVLEARPDAAPDAGAQAALAARADAALRAAEASEETYMEGGGRHAAAARVAGEALAGLALQMAPCPTAPHTPLFTRRLDEVRKLAGTAQAAAAVPRLQSSDEWAEVAAAELPGR